MFTLVKFHNDEYLIVKSKAVKIIKNDNCTIKYKGSSYAGFVIETNDNKEVLEVILNNRLKNRENSINPVQHEQDDKTVRIEKTDESIVGKCRIEDGKSRKMELNEESNSDTNYDSSDELSCQTVRKKMIRRVRWNTPEKQVINDELGNLKKLSRLPSLEKCRKIISKYPALGRRSAAQLKTYIDNQRRADARKKKREDLEFIESLRYTLIMHKLFGSTSKNIE